MKDSASQSISRRKATLLMAGAALSTFASPGDAISQQAKTRRRAPATEGGLSALDIAFLDEMQRSACLYFTEQADPASGQVLDRAANKTSTGNLDPRPAASIAATGFGLTALCIADKRGYRAPNTDEDFALKQVRSTLNFHLNNMPHERGFFYHFSNVRSGRPLSFSEVSSIDTAIFLCGVLTCRAHFNDSTVNYLATQLYNRVDWSWMLNGGTTFSMGWMPRSGFLSLRWDHYCELMMLYLLAIGSPTNPISPEHWANFRRPRMKYSTYDYIGGRDPLFVHQYSHAWFDFGHKRDAFANYFNNSVTATRAHKEWCMSLNRGYDDDYWGVSASDWQHGYTAWGGPPLMGPVDGSVVPAAVAGSLPFLPTECMRVLRSLKEKYGKDAWGRYGPGDAFHPDQLWYDPDVLGIDLGISLIMAENLRSRFVWDTFMSNPEAQNAMKLCGFKAE